MKINNVVPLPHSDSGMQHSIVRLNNSAIGKTKISRRTAMFILNKQNGLSTIRYAMGNSGNIKGLTKNSIALDYDAINELGIAFNRPEELTVTPATLCQSMRWLMTSSDLNVRLNTRFALLGAILGLVSLIITLITLF
ncbi:hypothetical protein VA249_45310 (plasmid) [Vibrio alfacsensis]|uniref:hypothetical protein n=1 Tax=Vibrio alfacsensis TaxID=1074311 RepID=UPI001BEDD679|nr:hypothetical protein [Vibrio alfacsensis]BBM67885.1 hypothetical protein VA249_45310 [Vibrio alfacsensis]